MKDAVGSTMLVYVVIIIVGIVGSILIASNMYTSAYKAKNNIIRMIDNHYMVNNDGELFENDEFLNSVSITLKNMGYHFKENNICKSNNVLKKVGKNNDDGDIVYELVYPKDDYKFDGYCVFKNTIITNREYYYTVVTFSHLNINVLGIGSLFSSPVYGETRTFYVG